MTSKIPISIPMLRRRVRNKIDTDNNSASKIPNLSKLSRKKKSTPRIWSLFSKRQQDDEEVLDEQMRKNLHAIGQVPAYLHERSQTFTKENSSVIPGCESNMIPIKTTNTEENGQSSSDTCLISQDVSDEGRNMVQSIMSAPSNQIINIIGNYSIDSKADLECCTKSRKEIELQLDELGHVVKKLETENRFLDGLRCDEMLPFLEAFLTCISFYGTEPGRKRNSQLLAEEEELQNLLATIGHLDFKSSQHRKIIVALKVRNRRYRSQVEKLQVYVRQFREQNKALKKELKVKQIIG